jgi:hypothetical protein
MSIYKWERWGFYDRDWAWYCTECETVMSPILMDMHYEMIHPEIDAMVLLGQM